MDNIGADEDMASRPRDDSMLGDDAKAHNAPGADYVRVPCAVISLLIKFRLIYH